MIALSLMTLLFSGSSSGYDYDQAWKQVEKALSEGLPKTALKKVDEIYQMATSEKNSHEIIKSTLYKTRLVLETEELGLEAVVSDLSRAIVKADDPVKQMLQSFAAEIFQSYYQNQYYRISQRTDLGTFVPDDMRTWSPNNYRNYISELYMNSLDGRKLRSTKTNEIKELLQSQDNIDISLRPTLYDLLLDRALSYFSQTGIQGIQPSFRFVMDDEDYLSPSESFSLVNIESEDEQSMTYRALSLYQNAIIENATNLAALVNYDLSRLDFVRFQGKVAGASDVYYKTLLASIKKYKGTTHEVAYRLAKAQYFQDKQKIAQALKEYKDLQKLKLTPPQKARVANRINQIKQPQLRVESELVYTTHENLLFNINYKNLDRVYLRLVKISTEDQIKMRGNRHRQGTNLLTSKKAIREWTIEMPKDKSYQNQSLETITEKLPLGTYAVIGSNGSSFRKGNDAFVYNIFHVSNLANINHRAPNKEVITVVDRATGKPTEGVEVDVYNLEYNRNERYQERIFLSTLRTNKLGKAYLKDHKGNNLVLVYRYGNDILDLNYSTYVGNYHNNRSESKVTEIFTDRAIYRPGQTVHFKILAMNLDKYSKPSVNANANYTVKLNDANGQKVTDLNLVTNEYGSASGSFTLPTGLLTGRFSIRTYGGSKSIRVEEYKRPKFEVKVDDIESQIALGDLVEISGKATALSGSPITSGKVKYSVTRHTYFGWWSWYRRSPSQVVQISTGEMLTGGDGAFSFDFKALADANMDIKKNPTYRYEIVIDVTDVSGETRSSTKSVNVSALPYSLSMDLGQIVEKEDTKKVTINAKNTEGKPVNTEVTLTIDELLQPMQWEKTRYWVVPKNNTYNRTEWDQKIHRIGYQGTSNLETYEVGKEVLTTKVKIVDGVYVYDVSKYVKAGKSYQVSLSSLETYEDDMHIENKARFAVKDSESGVLPPLKLLYIDGTDTEWKVGNKVNLVLGTPDEEVEVYYYITRDREIIKEALLCVDEKTMLAYTPVAADQGGITLQLHYVKHNRAHTENHNILIPWTDKHLDVELVTKRDKVLPGSKEEWTIKLKGPKADKVAAEMLATMYDASLDQFVSHGFSFNHYRSHFGYFNFMLHGFGLGQYNQINHEWNRVAYKDEKFKYPPSLRGVNYYGYGGFGQRYRGQYAEMNEEAMFDSDMSTMKRSKSTRVTAQAAGLSSAPAENKDKIEQESGVYTDGVKIGDVNGNSTSSETQTQEISPRKNLKETVFFYPHLHTDKEGNILISFTMNEALTKWKLLTFSHDKDLRYGMTSHEVKTQKDLMIVPNAPRFLHEGDDLVFPATVSNLTEKDIEVSAELKLENVLTGEDIGPLFGLNDAQRTIKVTAGESARVDWDITIPQHYKSLVRYTVVARSGQHTDGEENVLPVVTNQKLVTETEVISIKKFQTKTIAVDALQKQSSTMVPHAFTFEYTSNPVWYAVQALPYIMEYPHQCTEQVFNRYYANTLATHIANANPRIKEIFDIWKATDSDALLSNLEKNTELKYALLEESPWVREAQSETEQKKRIALLFDINKMASETKSTLRVLRERQLGDGSFPWFMGGRGDEYITQIVVMGIAHLEKLGVLIQGGDEYRDMLDRAITYLDHATKRRYDKLRHRDQDHLDYRSIQYLYIRSFYPQKEVAEGTKVAYDYYFGQAKKYWLGKGLYSEAMIGLTLLRAGDEVADKIKASLDERSFYSEELGRYWNLGSSYQWYQLPIETHAKLIEFFTEADQQGDFVEDMKIWLLKNKQTNHWKTTKATADAIYAILLQGEDGKMISWVESDNKPVITFTNTVLDIPTEDIEAGTGYIKRRYKTDEITEDMQSITIKNNSESIGWGATYYQYFEDLDKIEGFVDTPLKMTKTLYKEVQSDRGPQLVALNDGEHLTIGDRVISRIELRVDRNMSYVHLKDMRASGLEPENVLSQYKWQGGLGYYESTRDLATNFFIGQLRKGTYVFEYPLRVVHKGNFSSGIATLQCMYAPEFTSHSEGVRVVVR